MTVLYGSIITFASGWKFRGEFGPKDGLVEVEIEGILDKPAENLHVPHAELVNAKIGSFQYMGLVGPEFFNIRTRTLPEVMVLGKLGEPVALTHIAGRLQIVPINH